MLKKIENTSVTYLMILIVAIAIGGMIIWPLLDLLIAAVFTHSEFEYSVVKYVTEPIVFGGILGTVFWVIDRKRAKK